MLPVVCLQKEILLQDPQEQEAAVRREVAHYQAVDHPNVVKLIAHELRLHQGHLRAYLVFPYYQVSCEGGVGGMHAPLYPVTGRHPGRQDCSRLSEQCSHSRGSGAEHVPVSL